MSSRIAFIGAGRLGQALARALAARGESVVAVASRSAASAQALAVRLPDCQALEAQQAVDAADLVFLTVGDDTIAPLCASLRWRAGQSVVHCSGATELAALAAAGDAGAAVGGFHPLQIFSDPEQAIGLLAGAAVAIEADEPLMTELRRLATLLGMKPLSLRPGTRAAYHGAASFAASYLLSMLDEAAQVWSAIGVQGEEPAQSAQDLALQALLPLARGTLAAAESRGLAGALAGPISRGDLGVVAAHLRALDALGGEHGRFCRELARRQLPLARAAGRLDAATLARLGALLEAPPA